MSDDVHVQADVTAHGPGKFTFILSLSTLTVVAGLCFSLGRMSQRLDQVEKDVSDRSPSYVVSRMASDINDIKAALQGQNVAMQSIRDAIGTRH